MGQVQTSPEMVPDPSWVADPVTPIRQGETLGDYFDWAFPLYFAHCRNAIQRQAARKYYGMDASSEAVEICLQDFSREELNPQ